MVDTGSGGLCRLMWVLFEAYWGEHADRGVSLGAVVAFLDPACGGDLGFGFPCPMVSVVEPGLEGRPERLGGGSVTYTADAATSPLPWGVDVRRSYGGTRPDQRQVIELAKLGKIALEYKTHELDNGLQAFADLAAGIVPGRAILLSRDRWPPPEGNLGRRRRRRAGSQVLAR